jgi:hypothetical protein
MGPVPAFVTNPTISIPGLQRERPTLAAVSLCLYIGRIANDVRM